MLCEVGAGSVALGDATNLSDLLMITNPLMLLIISDLLILLIISKLLMLLIGTSFACQPLAHFLFFKDYAGRLLYFYFNTLSLS